MVVLSVLRQSSQISRIFGSFSPCIRSNLSTKHPFIVTNQLRLMSSHKQLMHVKPSRFQWHKFKDLLHFYTLLGAVPLTVLVFCVNIFIGPAQLAEIPEGYEPKHWEYYPHPIQRFFARYIYPSPEQNYEKTLHHIWVEKEKQKLRRLEWKVQSLMSQRGDYKAWYFVPVEGKYVRYARKVEEEKELMDAL